MHGISDMKVGNGMQAIGISPSLVRLLAKTAPDLLAELFVAGKVVDAEVISVFQDRAMLSFGKGVRLEVALQAMLKEGQKVKLQVQPREQGNGLVLKVIQPAAGQSERGATARPAAPAGQVPTPLPGSSAPEQASPASTGSAQPPVPASNPAPGQGAAASMRPPAPPSGAPAQAAGGQQAPSGQLQASLPGQSGTAAPQGRPGPNQTDLAPGTSPAANTAPPATAAPQPAQRAGEPQAGSSLPNQALSQVALSTTGQAPAPQTPAAQAQAGQNPVSQTAQAAPTATTPDQAAKSEPPLPGPPREATPAGPGATRPDGPQARADAGRPEAMTPRPEGPLPGGGQQAQAQAARTDGAQGRADAAQTQVSPEVAQPLTQAPVPQLRPDAGQPPLMWIPIPLENGKQGWAQLQIQERDARSAREHGAQHQIRLWWETPALGQIQVTMDASDQSLTTLFTVLLTAIRAGVERGLTDLQTRLAATGFDEVKIGCRQALPGESIGPAVPAEGGSRLDRRM